MTRSDPNAFYLALEQTPGDTVTLQAVADWFEEQGHLDTADCLRWLARKRLFPFRYRAEAGLSVSGATWRDNWYWWAIDDPYYGRDWGHPTTCRLPHGVWKHLKHSLTYTPGVFKDYESMQSAHEALFDAWSKVPHAEREKLS